MGKLDTNEFMNYDKKQAFMSGAPGKKPIPVGPNITLLSGEVNNVSRRLRTLEERYLNLRKKSQLAEQNMLLSNKKLLGKIRDAFDEVAEIKTELKKMNEQIGIMTSELQDCANRNDLMTVEKYLDFWEPMNFVTEQEAKRIVSSMKEAGKK